MNKNPCADCAGGPACADCPVNPENGVPAKLYTPKGAVRAMLAGKVLKNKLGDTVFWDNSHNGFYRKNSADVFYYAVDFSGLYAEGA